MKLTFSAAKIIANMAKSRLMFYFTALGLAMSFQIATVSAPAHAYPKYVSQNGVVGCTKCHTSRGINNGNMKEFTTAGNYFKNYRKLPGNKSNNNNNNRWGNNNNNNNNRWGNNNNNNNNRWGNNNNNNNRWGNNNNNNNRWGNNNNNNNRWGNNNNNNNRWGNNNNNNNRWGNNNNNNRNGYSCGRGFRTEDRADYQGNDIQGFRDGFNSCKQRCRNNWRCRGISWIKTNANKKCWLKYGMYRSSYKWSVVSCVKR